MYFNKRIRLCTWIKWTIGSISYQLVSANIWRHQLTVWWRKRLNKIFRLHSIARIFTDCWLDVSKMKKKTGPKNQKKYVRKISVFPVFFCGHFIPPGTRLGQSDHSMFSNMLKCSQRHNACKILAQSPASGPPARQFKNWFESPWLSSFERAINRLSDSNIFRRHAV